ncbi:hypothetical protein GLAREA_04776 [Glarea lozoyensis ATCC 20868]|uniref:Uncharacterized protein n=1 Tax=Glarea lozoyensis (strain ATCC 20868 / MF5171) TaxID=1116229 RepID=S3CQL8_GLAL2|nr:uncharacterized protein GLAREA_04776 [Glarea lozoyensis ATCC 20868]EPE27985.1 hypothetical protein GLAREA_04776 [Glarea lozoyensis ATCC 20868]
MGKPKKHVGKDPLNRAAAKARKRESKSSGSVNSTAMKHERRGGTFMSTLRNPRIARTAHRVTGAGTVHKKEWLSDVSFPSSPARLPVNCCVSHSHLGSIRDIRKSYAVCDMEISRFSTFVLQLIDPSSTQSQCAAQCTDRLEVHIPHPLTTIRSGT